MGVRLIILLGVLGGVLYCVHLLVQDYQALTAAKFLRFLFKRDLSQQNYSKPNVRWKKILLHDPIQCARYLYCDLGARPADTELRQGFILMLTLEPRKEDETSQQVFQKAYNNGKAHKDPKYCEKAYSYCPFKATVLFDLIRFLLRKE